VLPRRQASINCSEGEAPYQLLSASGSMSFEHVSLQETKQICSESQFYNYANETESSWIWQISEICAIVPQCSPPDLCPFLEDLPYCIFLNEEPVDLPIRYDASSSVRYVVVASCHISFIFICS
jgi:hypothetical protein